MMPVMKLNVLSLEDSVYDYEIILDQLKDAGFNLNISRIEKESEFVSELRHSNWDIILADFRLPGFDAFKALKICNEICPDVPFICVSGFIGEETAIELIKAGAEDYVLKDRLGRLPFAINRALDNARDKKARKQAEDALRESERMLKEAQLIARLGAYSMDIPSFQWKSSEVLNHIFGLEANLNNSIDDWTSVLHPDWKQLMTDYLANEVIGKKTNFDKEYKIIRKNDHAERWVHGLGSLKFDDDHQLVAMIGTVQDITDSKLVQQELILAKEKAEENERLKSAFLANMSHEIRTPMNGILGFAALLKEPKLSGEEQQEYIDIIEKSGARMLNIINDVITISKVESGQMKTFISPTNINGQIGYIYNFFKPEVEKKGMNIFFKTALSSDDSIVKTDKEKIYAILTNLVKNAIKFSDKGTIEIGYNLVETHGSASPGSAFLQFYVKDTGVGIPKDRLDAIFDRFVQADIADKRAFQGAGLGLSITKAFVEMLGGKIWVESEVGKGSVFYFTIPYNAGKTINKAIKNALPNDIQESQLKSLKILIAEDDEISEMLIGMAVRTFGKKVLKSRTGFEAVEVCRKNPDIDFVLMDIKMPEMDGYEATRQIRQFNNDVIIIAQTAYALTGDREKALEAGCNDYIAKPFGQSSLLALMRKHIQPANY